jgi:hypothetical protein
MTMEDTEITEVKKLPLNKIWINAFGVVPKIPDEKFVKEVGEMVIGQLKSKMIECQNNKEYPYQVVILFTAS